MTRPPRQVHGAPICGWCGVTALPGRAVGRPDLDFVCDQADCPAEGTRVIA